MKYLIAFIFSLSLSLFAFGQKVPSPYPLYNTLHITGQYAIGPVIDTTISFYFYDSSHREVKYLDYTVKKGIRYSNNLVTYSYDSGGTYVFSEASTYNSKLNQFVKNSGYQARYDASGHRVYVLSGFFNGTNFLVQTIYNYSYDSLGRNIVSSSLDTMEKTGEKNHYTYNSSGALITDTQFFWYNKTNKWENESVERWIKNKIDSDSIHTVQIWDGKIWANKTRTQYFYDSLKRMDSIIYSQGMNSSWMRDTRDSFVYDSVGWIRYINKWDSISEKWKTRDALYAYTGSKESFCEDFKYWDSTSKSYRELLDDFPWCFQYDKAGNLVRYYCDGSFDYYQWDYDSLERIKHYSYYGVSSGDDIYYYYYQKYASIEEPVNLLGQAHLFPNPSSGNYTLSFPENFSGELIVYDITGAIKMNQNISGQNKISFDLKEPAGMYFLRVIEKNTNNVYTQKLIKY